MNGRDPELIENVARHLADEDATTRGALPYADTSWACVRDRWLPKAERLLTTTMLAGLLAGHERAWALTYSSDDGSEYEHRYTVGDAPVCEGADDCPACWAADIRSALTGGRS